MIEDSKFTAEDIENEFGWNISHMVEILSRKQGEKYLDYIERVKNGGEVCIIVKYNDLLHNSDLSRIKHPTKNDYDRVEKYKKAIKILMDEWIKS